MRLFLAQPLRPISLAATGALITPLGLGGVTLALFVAVALLVGLAGARAASDLQPASQPA